MPLLLDLFCCAGGAARGYAQAGFTVVGVDINRMKRYPYEFVQGDALELMRTLLDGGTIAGYSLDDFDAFHGSPPCQAFSSVSNCVPGTKEKYPNLIPGTRALFMETGKPWVIENVVHAPLVDPVILCGSMFDLEAYGYQIRRHRLFENSFGLIAPGECKHGPKTMNPYSAATRRKFLVETGLSMTSGPWQKAMGISGTSQHEVREAVPPAYTRYIGEYLLSNVIEYRLAA